MNFFAAAIVICLPLAVTAQNYCSCSPTSYTFQFNFTATCNTSTIEENPGIVDTRCRITDDTTPTNITGVTSVRFREYGVDSDILIDNVIPFNPPITDEGTFSLTSTSDRLNTSEPLANQMYLVPGRVRFDIIAGNDDLNVVWWDYNTTNCNVEPLAVGDTIGWVTLVNYTLPKAAFCAAVVTESPTAAPSVSKSGKSTSSKGSKSEGASAKSAKMAMSEEDVDTEAQKMNSKSHTEMMTKKNFKVVESMVKNSKDHHHLIMEEDASMSMNVALSFNMIEDDSMSYKARVPSTHVEKSPFGRRNGLRSHEE